MKHSVKNISRLFGISIMMITIAALSAANVQTAMAAPGLGSVVSPSTPVVNGPVNVGPGDPAGAVERYENTRISVYSPFPPLTNVVTPGFDLSDPANPKCVMASHPLGGANDQRWDLWAEDIDGGAIDNPGPAMLDVGLDSFVTAEFGLQKKPVLINLGTGGSLSPGIQGDLFWREVEGPNAGSDQTDVLAQLVELDPQNADAPKYHMAVCSERHFDANDTPLGPTVKTDNWFTALAVGGSIIPVDSVSILVAGLFATPMMALPLIGAAAGFGLAGFALTKLRSKKQS